MKVNATKGVMFLCFSRKSYWEGQCSHIPSYTSSHPKAEDIGARSTVL